MMNRQRMLKLVPALCAIFIVLVNTVLKPAHASDFSVGLVVGVLLGISILALRALNRKPVCAR
jgi:hypothetical protein